MGKKIIAVLCVLLTAVMPVCIAETQSYGPGHETHQYACWDNGDGTHTVACDCGVEKRLEPHKDMDKDGACDSCGMIIEAADEAAAELPDGWKNIWNEEGGIIFSVPGNVISWTLSDEDAAILWRGSSQDITVQLRAYEADELTYEEFIAMLGEYEYAVTDVRSIDGTEITVYNNPEPAANMQLSGAVLNGVDGRLYKLSVFSGDSDDFSEDAAVWELADTVMQSVHVRRFFGWNIYKERTY